MFINKSLLCFLVALPSTVLGQGKQFPMKRDGQDEVPPEFMENFKNSKQAGPGPGKKGFATNFGGSCFFTCPGGHRPFARPGHTPVVDGCGFPINIDGLDVKSSKFDFRGCCNEQDRCYGKCNEKKEKCDEEFHGCLKMWCDYTYGNSRNKQKQELLAECNKKAELYNTMTKLMQCETYQNAQSAACDCPSVKKEEKVQNSKVVEELNMDQVDDDVDNDEEDYDDEDDDEDEDDEEYDDNDYEF
ncbi:hypothetical protein MP228_001095 [Amoeboaphelidium protococcarum]|nr:hypothetical protein MP228_001095 [Amoeboaphelidium protococcarum]